MALDCDLANWFRQAAEYAKESFTNYTILVSKYIPAKNKRLYDGSTRKQSLDVFFLFLVKSDGREAVSLKEKIYLEYHAPKIPYYLEPKKYH